MLVGDIGSDSDVGGVTTPSLPFPRGHPGGGWGGVVPGDPPGGVHPPAATPRGEGGGGVTHPAGVGGNGRRPSQ